MTYPKKEDVARMEEEARAANKMRKQEKDEKWEKKRKIENPVWSVSFRQCFNKHNDC